MKKYLVLLLALISVSCSTNNAPKRHTIEGFAQGSTYKIVYYHTDEIIRQSAIDSILNEFNLSCNMFDSTSLVSRLNRNETDTVDRYITDCEALAREIYTISEGAYDITSEPLSRAYGFLNANKVDNINIDSLLLLVGHDKIRIEDSKLIKADPRMAINLNSIAQGYSTDLLAQYILSEGVSNFLVELGGEIYCAGVKADGKKWKVGVDKPIDGNMTAGSDLETTIELSDRGLNTSGNYRKFYEKDGHRFNHILDPRTGDSSSNDMLSATVIASTAALTDGLATMMMVIGSKKCKEFLSSRDDIEGYIVYHENDSIKTFSTIKR